MSQMLLEIRNLTKVYTQRSLIEGKRTVVALQDFSLAIPERPPSVITIAGESGSGKTTLANLVLGFIRPTSGQIIYKGQDISTASSRQIKDYRREVQAVFQDPFGVYNPFYRVCHVFDLIIDDFRLSTNKMRKRDIVEEALNVVGLHGEDVLRKYPHQLSGGQRQRIMMARAYLIKPKLIIADEPVSMIDASLRASILDVMIRLKEKNNISFLFITHDLSTAYQISDQIHVLYQGIVTETGNTLSVINRPHHPYVQLLVDSVPIPDPNVKWKGEIVLPAEEEMRSSIHSGCRFYPRCPQQMGRCLAAQPALYQVADEHQVACYLYDAMAEGLPEAQLSAASVAS